MLINFPVQQMNIKDHKRHRQHIDGLALCVDYINHLGNTGPDRSKHFHW